jgi:hypothetical protein
LPLFEGELDEPLFEPEFEPLLRSRPELPLCPLRLDDDELPL